MSHYLTDISQGLFHISSNPHWCADEINTLVKYCGRHQGGIRLYVWNWGCVLMNFLLMAFEPVIATQWLALLTFLVCFPIKSPWQKHSDCLPSASPFLSLPSPLPAPAKMLSVYMFFRIHEYRIKPQEFLPMLVVWRDQSSNIIRAFRHAHCFCSACKKWGRQVLLIHFLYLCSLAEEGQRSWGRWALMA